MVEGALAIVDWRLRAADAEPLMQLLHLDGSEETVAEFGKMDLVTTRLGSWYGVTPDGSIIALREAGNEEIYALSFAER